MYHKTPLRLFSYNFQQKCSKTEVVPRETKHFCVVHIQFWNSSSVENEISYSADEIYSISRKTVFFSDKNSILHIIITHLPLIKSSHFLLKTPHRPSWGNCRKFEQQEANKVTSQFFRTRHRHQLFILFFLSNKTFTIRFWYGLDPTLAAYVRAFRVTWAIWSPIVILTTEWGKRE